MSAIRQKSAVLVLSTAGGEVGRVAVTARALAGVIAVIVDPARGQVVVRYDEQRVSREQIHSAVRPAACERDDGGFWLNAWPRLASALPTAAALL